MIPRLAGWAIDRPVTVLAVALLIVLSLAAGLGFLGFRSDHRIFFSNSDEDLVAFDRLEQTYTKNDNLIFIVTSKQGDVFTADILETLLEMTESAWHLRYVKRVDSIVNFQHVRAEGEDDVIIDHLLREGDPVTADAIARIRKAALGEPLLVNRLISPDGSVTGVLARFDFGISEKSTAIPEIMAEARALAADVAARHPDIELRISGSVPMDYAFEEASAHDLSVLTPLMFVVVGVLIAVVLGSVWAAILTLCAITLSILAALGAAGWLGIPLSPPSVTAPNIILTLATADAIHLIWGTIRHAERGLSRKEAVRTALIENFRPIFFTSITTAVGFLSLLASESPPFQHLGAITGIGVLVAWFLTVTVFAAALSRLPLKVRRTSMRLVAICEGVSGVVGRRPGQTIVVVAAISIVLAATAFSNELDDRFVEYFDDSFAFRRDTDYLNERLTGIYYIDYSLRQEQSGGITDPEYLRETEAFANWFRLQPEVVHVEAITDIFKRINQVMHGDRPDAYRLPSRRDEAAQYLLLYEMSIPNGLDLKDRITVDKAATRMTVTLHNISTANVLALEARAEAWAAENLDLVVESKGTGTTVMFSNIGMRNIRDMLTGTFGALLGISFLLVFVFRSTRAGAIGLATNMLPALVALGAWALVIGEVGMAVSVIAAMTLGIVVDDTIHFTEKFLYARRGLGLDPVEAVRHAFVAAGPAILAMVIVLASGFFCLSLSGFQINAWIGLMTAITIIVSLAIAFTLLPAMLIKMGK